ncbi:anthranilate synthase component I family protein [Aureibacter tunicatorum]|uniref:Para-aminobenzoate synthetase component 1 n=1 Tax=Aureibacter tunicatorum TaxID=866807 RepID=A0AAE3XMU1_9BACT|nr:anthranilate synthase component I family protein [Aureibacter tunicatorum]MDR6239362.1 para-aminobenzoate synthetase component 1 [Aureibacter tunicatorum]BDD04715.1 para-aminobenzoate synthase [Aureibacter tunicatorum]
MIKRFIKNYKVNKISDFKSKSLKWAEQFDHFEYLNPNNFQYPNDPFIEVLAVGANDILTCKNDHNAFEALKRFKNSKKDWLFGYFSYDLKNYLEDLKSENPDRIEFSDLMFFQPTHLLFFNDDEIEIQSLTNNNDEVFEIISDTPLVSENNDEKFEIKSAVSKENYIQTVEKLKNHILEGDIYETNYCQEFYGENVDINPISKYLELNAVSPTPFSVMLKDCDKFLMGASPERYIKRVTNKCISQPIKGTIKRGLNLEEDEMLKHALLHDPKERAENLMIVDLVRNDLARVSTPGTVHVDELFGIYSFKQVHQMISTISSEVSNVTDSIDIIKNTFPMGSMTGAPKISMMNLAEKYETTKRGLYSGAVGYFTPTDDFDFNVVIRSILYNQTRKSLSFMVGSAITFDSDPAKEYEECLLKAKAIIKILN